MGFLPALAQDKEAKLPDMPGPNQITVNGFPVASLQQAFNNVVHNGMILLGPGEYKMAGELKKNNVWIKGSPGTVLNGVSAKGKGAIVLRANNTIIDTIECKNISVPSKNGACVRLEGSGLKLKNVYFHDSEQGLLSWSKAGDVEITDSRFIRLGKNGRAHGIYQGGGRLKISRSVFLGSKDQGHAIKSRADYTIIEDSIIATHGGGR